MIMAGRDDEARTSRLARILLDNIHNRLVIRPWRYGYCSACQISRKPRR